MQVSELYQLTQWVKLEIIEKNIHQKFTNLVKLLNINARRGNNQQAQPFESAKIEVVKSINSVNLNILTLSQLDTLKEIGIKENIGKEGEEKISAIPADRKTLI